jgi:hypothetical protein
MWKPGGIWWAVSLNKTLLVNNVFIAHKKDKVARDCRKLHNEELHLLLTKYYLGDQIKEKVIARLGTMRNA